MVASPKGLGPEKGCAGKGPHHIKKRQTRPLVRESAPQEQDRNCHTSDKYLVMGPRWGSTPRHTDWLTDRQSQCNFNFNFNLSIVQWQRVHRAHSDLDSVIARMYSCWNYGAANVAPTQKDRPLPSSKRRPNLKTHTSYMPSREQKSWLLISRRPEVRIDCAGEGQQQFNRPTRICVTLMLDLRFSRRWLWTVFSLLAACFMMVSDLAYSTLKMEVIYSSETSVDSRNYTRYSPGDRNLLYWCTGFHVSRCHVVSCFSIIIKRDIFLWENMH
jgi:hypothetical protein